jgi:hypothetical protein
LFFQNKDNKYIGVDHYVAGIEYLPTNTTRITLEGFYKQYFNYSISEKDGMGLKLISSGNVVKRLVFIGRLTKSQKQPHWMLDISEYTNLPVVFYGDGLFKDELMLSAQARNLNAEFHGFVSNILVRRK